MGEGLNGKLKRPMAGGTLDKPTVAQVQYLVQGPGQLLCGQWSSSQLAHDSKMRGNRLGHGRKFVVAHLELAAGLLYNPADGRVMNMADAWKQVMLDLKIQATG